MSTHSDDQSQPADSLVDRGVDDVLDEGMSPHVIEDVTTDATYDDESPDQGFSEPPDE